MAILGVRVALNASTATALLAKGSSAGQIPEIEGVAGDPLPVLIQNADAAIVIYLGGPTVTEATGFPLAAGESVPMSLIGGDIPYAIAASGTPSCSVLVGRQ